MKTTDSQAFPPGIARAVDSQRREVRRRLAIIAFYEELVPPGRTRKGHKGVVLADHAIRQRFGITSRTVQMWRAQLWQLRRQFPTLLFGMGLVRFADLPGRCRRAARRRLKLLENWRRVVEVTRSHRPGLTGGMTDAWLAKHPALARSTVYKWHREYRRHGLAGLVDDRSLFVIRRGPKHRTA